MRTKQRPVSAAQPRHYDTLAHERVVKNLCETWGAHQIASKAVARMSSTSKIMQISAAC